MDIRIIGAGLIGASIGLAAKQRGDSVTFEDLNSENLRVAQDLVGGDPKSSSPDLVVIATPPKQALTVLLEEFERNPQAMFIDICGLKSELVHEIESFSELASRFCGSHPMAGRELSGPTAARADLFQGATWVLTPTSQTDPAVVEAARKLASDLGAIVQVVPADLHDEVISTVSHLPQLMSTILARALTHRTDDELGLSGQGLRDVTRLAESNAKLWADLLIRNRRNVSMDLERVQKEIAEALIHLAKQDDLELEKFISKGNLEKSRIPGKHGGKSRDYVYLPIVIEDKAGQLAAIFDECAVARVNVEDLFIEHSPGQETGLITLALSQDDANILRPHLVEKNWRVHALRANR